MEILRFLHDATLFGFSLEWKTGVVEFYIGDYDDNKKKSVERTIVCINSIVINCPRLYEWGESCFIYSIELDIGQNTKTIKIQMQSGDLISVQAEEIYFDNKPISP